MVIRQDLSNLSWISQRSGQQNTPRRPDETYQYSAANMFNDIPADELLFCIFGLALAATYYIRQLYGPRLRLATLSILMRITSSQAFILFWALWLLIKPTSTFIARSISPLIPASIPHFFFYELPIFLSGKPATSRHNRRFNRTFLEINDFTPDTTPHSNATLKSWIDEDAASDSERRRRERADAKAKDRQNLLNWRLSRANSLSSSPATPLVDSLLDASWCMDPSPLASNTALAELRTSDLSHCSSDSGLSAQLPDWMRQVPRYHLGKLDNGSYVARVPGFARPLHFDPERKLYSSTGGSLGKEAEEKMLMERAWEELGRRGTGL